MSWLWAFLFTQAIEVPIYARILSGSWPRRLALAFGASAVTHPLIYLVLPELWPGSYLGYVALAEAIAVAGEAIWLSSFGVKQSVAWALLANGLSAGLGLGVRHYLGWL